jgi:hypothetical protein
MPSANAASGSERVLGIRTAANCSDVWTVRTVGAVPVPGVTVGGAKLAVAPSGSPVTDIFTGLLKFPPMGATLSGKDAVPPGLTRSAGVGDATEKSVGAVTVALTVPVSGTLALATVVPAEKYVTVKVAV